MQIAHHSDTGGLKLATSRHIQSGPNSAMLKRSSIPYSLIPWIAALVLAMMTEVTHGQRTQKSIKFNVGYDRTLPVGMAQKWMKMIADAGADGVRLVSNPDQPVRLAEDKFKSKSTVQVFAKIDKRQNLIVEGASFNLSDSASLKRWITRIKSLKSIHPDQQPGAFGLTNEQLVKVYEVLGKPYPKSTRDQPTADVVRTIRSQLGVKISADSAALEALADEESRVPEELKGLSCGTVLAAAIRPLGLVLTIGNEGKQFSIVQSKSVDEHWPVGWPIQERPSKIAPVLFKQTEVDIEGFPLNEVLQAIEAKTKIPFVFDQNTMARHGIEMHKVIVNIGRQKTFYEKIIRLCLAQSRPQLKAEIRADEAGQPFLWISR